MTDAEFVYLVAQMRRAQKAYFANRSPLDLRESKQLERRVDDEIKRREAGQEALF